MKSPESVLSKPRSEWTPRMQISNPTTKPATSTDLSGAMHRTKHFHYSKRQSTKFPTSQNRIERHKP